MRILLAALMLVSFFGPTAVYAEGSSCPAPTASSSSELIHQRSDQIDEGLLFVQIPDAARDNDAFLFQYFIGGQLAGTESVELTAGGDPQGLVLELFSRDKKLRLDFIAAAQRHGDAAVEIIAGEELVTRMSLEELLSQSRAYIEDMEAPLPVASTSEARVLAPRLLASSAGALGKIPTKITPCEEQCLAQFPCVPLPNGGFSCDPGLVPCLEQCDDCEVSSEIVEDTVLFSITALGPTECFYDFGFARVYEWSRIRYKTTRKRIDYNADCTTTVTILQVTYQDFFCYYPGVVTGCFDPTTKYGTCF